MVLLLFFSFVSFLNLMKAQVLGQNVVFIHNFTEVDNGESLPLFSHQCIVSCMHKICGD